MRILWVLNKYVDGGSLSRFYPSFLKYVEQEVEKSGNKIYFVFFSSAMRARAKTKNNLFYSQKKIRVKSLNLTASKIEGTYGFTFKQAYFPDLIQVSESQNYRKLHLKEKGFNSLSFLVPRFLYLEKVIEQKAIDAVFCDQSPEVEMELARAICLKKKKIFLRRISSFLGRGVFCQQFEFGKERVALPAINSGMALSDARKFVNDFTENSRPPYLLKPRLQADFRGFYFPRLLRFYRYSRFIKIALISPFLFIEDKFLKPLYMDKADQDKPYLFFGLHLPIESTVALRALPYMNQISLIESISRVLPYGHYLYVREHPQWRKHFPLSYLKKLKSLPSVRLISPKLPIATILRHSQGVLTYNATTGIEALMYGKPVLSFAPNVYYGFHPAVDHCSNLYDIGAKLAKLINTKVNMADTYRYILRLMCSTSEIPLSAETFLSNSDSLQKAPIFTKELLAAVSWCAKSK